NFAAATPNAVSARTARRHKRAARRARVAEAARRAAQADAQTVVAARVRTTEVGKPVESPASASSTPAATSAPAPAAKPVQMRPATFRKLGSMLAAWNTRLNRWATRKSSNKPRGKRLFQIGLAGIALLVVAEIIGE